MYIYILLSALKGTVAGNFLFKEEEGMLKIGKKVISAVLTLCIVCSVFSVTAFAESESAVGGQGVQTNIGDDMNIRGTNSFGSMVTSELEQESDKQEENNGFNIFSVEVTGKTATAEFETLQDSTLVVAIYDESGVEMLASGKAEVKKEDKTAEVTIDIETMPKYFYLRAFLVDEEVYRPLCSAYESPNYTQEMQEFFAKTTDDFESDKVLNLDSDKANNFAVYDEETKIIEQNGNKNQVASVDDEGQKYVIENADSSITSLKAGDIFSYNYGDDELLIVKVKSISVSGTTATIYGDEVELDEVFDYVKIDENADLSNAEVDPSTCDEGVTYEGMNEESDPEGLSSVGASIEGSMSKSISLKIKSLVEGGIDLKVEAKTKVYVTLQYQYVEFSIDYSVKISVAVKVDIIDAKIRLASIAISPVPGLYIELTPSIVFEGNVKVELSGTLKGSIGIRATGDTGIENISKTPSFKTELKVEGTFFVGLSMEPRVGIVGSIATIGLEAKAGAEIKASLSIYNSDDYKLTPSVKHDCKKCVAGTISAKFSLSGDVCFLKMDKLKYKKTFLESKIKLCDFYYSFDFNEFAFTTCPHQKYKVTVTVKDSKGDPVSGATVNNDYTTNDDGVAELYLNAGQYNITASKAGAGDAKKSITIADYSKSITLKLSEKLTDFRIIEDFNQEIGNVNRISLGNSHSGAITENGDLYMWGYNGHGQLGNGASTQRLTPTKIMSNVKAVGLGYDHSAAITESGDLYTWGDNYYGQLGDGTTTDRYTPTKIMSNVKAVSLGHHHSAAITENGDLYMWGENYHGQLGDGTHGSTNDRYTPTKIMSNVKAVSLDEWHSGAITENGDLYMWGLNNYGQIGDGTTTDRHTPTKITIPPANAKFLEAVSASGGSKTEAFTGLQPNEVYNFYSMKTKDAENPFGSVNLLYITQATADENGNLSITYKSDESYDKAINFVVPLKQIDVSTAAVTMDNLNYNGQNQYVKPVVTLNGKTLTEGEDYDLSGDYFAKDAGNYTVTISGRGLFTGEVDFNYSVIVPDKFGDVNLDGRSDIQDVTQLQRYLAHMISFNDEQKIIADVNGDGIIAIDDATIIQIYLAEYLQLV